MVEFEEISDFSKFVRLERYLEKILGVRVDLQTRESISPYIRVYRTGGQGGVKQVELKERIAEMRISVEKILKEMENKF